MGPIANAHLTRLVPVLTYSQELLRLVEVNRDAIIADPNTPLEPRIVSVRQVQYKQRSLASGSGQGRRAYRARGSKRSRTGDGTEEWCSSEDEEGSGSGDEDA